MFSGLTARLETEIEIVKRVLSLHDAIRSKLYEAREVGSTPVQVATPSDDLVGVLTSVAPGKLEWQIYDHCAAFSRLYGVYAQFVDDLVGDYLSLLPRLFLDYSKLPERILNQHRVGFAQILAKLGSGGPYRHLDELLILEDLASAVGGEQPYKLLKEAFFVDRQNYRLEPLSRLLGSIGIESAASKIKQSQHMRAFLQTRLDSFSIDKELSDFIEYRNLAAHTQVDEIVAIDDIASYADLLVAICRALADVIEDEIIQRQAERTEGVELGVVTQSIRQGYVVVASVGPVRLEIGEKLALLRAGRIKVATIDSIQINGVACAAVVVKQQLEVGLQLSCQCKRDAVLFKTRQPSTPAPVGIHSDQASQLPPESAEIDALGIDLERENEVVIDEDVDS